MLQEQNNKFEQQLLLANNRFDALKQHAESKLDEANTEIAKVRKEYEKEIVGYKARCKRYECTTSTLEKALKSKEEENKELYNICDALEKQLEIS